VKVPENFYVKTQSIALKQFIPLSHVKAPAFNIIDDMYNDVGRPYSGANSPTKNQKAKF